MHVEVLTILMDHVLSTHTLNWLEQDEEGVVPKPLFLGTSMLKGIGILYCPKANHTTRRSSLLKHDETCKKYCTTKQTGRPASGLCVRHPVSRTSSLQPQKWASYARYTRSSTNTGRKTSQRSSTSSYQYALPQKINKT